MSVSNSRQIKLGAILSYLSIFINILTGLLYTPWMIESIGQANYGLYTLAISVTSLFVFDFGLSAAVTRFISNFLADNDQASADKCLGSVYKLYLYIDVVFIILLTSVYFFIPQIYMNLTVDEIARFKIVYVIVATYSVLSFPFIPVNGVLTAHEKFIPLKFCDIFHKLFIVITMSVCLLLGYGLYALVLVNALSGLLTIALKLFYISKTTPQKVDFRGGKSFEIKKLLTFSGWVTIQSIAQRCIFNIAPSILAMLSGAVEVALLGVAVTIEGYVYTFANAISGMFLPRVSRVYSQGDGNILPLMVRIGRIQMFLISFIVFILICFGNEFINLWVGRDFSQSYTCFVLLILPSLLHLPQEIGKQAIIALNKVKYQAIVYLLMAIINVLLVFLLSPIYGAIGVCISICISYILRTIGLDIIMYKSVGINIFSFFKNVYLKLLIPLVITFIIGVVLNHAIVATGWFLLFIKIIIFSISYVLIMYRWGMNQSEKELVEKLLKFKI